MVRVNITKKHLYFLVGIFAIVGIGFVVAQFPNPGHDVSQVVGLPDFSSFCTSANSDPCDTENFNLGCGCSDVCPQLAPPTVKKKSSSTESSSAMAALTSGNIPKYGTSGLVDTTTPIFETTTGIGIGTTTPFTRFHVEGTSRFTDSMIIASPDDIGITFTNNNVIKWGSNGYIKGHPNGLAISGVSTSSGALFVGSDQVTIRGDLAVDGAKFFDIEHPNKEKAAKGERLRHAAVEAPEVRLYYEGKNRIKRGKSVIELPDYFNDLIVGGSEIVYLTKMSKGDVWVESENYDNNKVVVGGKEGTEFSWMVTGIREGYDDFEAEYKE